VDLQARARAALAARLRELVPADALHPAGTHTLRLADALAGPLTGEDVAWVHDQLAARAKGELRPSRAGTVQAHAAWSSTALAGAAAAAWRAAPHELPEAPGATGLRLEARLPIPHGGGTPNLDVALDLPGPALLGVESKLTEHLALARPRPWKPAYHRPAMAAALAGGWRTTFEDLLAGRWAPRHLDAGQLVRHALSLHRRGTLAYVFWEPSDVEAHPELRTHRAELDELRERVGDAPPRLCATSWPALLDGWAPHRPGHVAALRERYGLAIGGRDA
jgi:hypothetical protein